MNKNNKSIIKEEVIKEDIIYSPSIEEQKELEYESKYIDIMKDIQREMLEEEEARYFMD